MKDEYIKTILQLSKLLEDQQFDIYIKNETIKALEKRLADAEGNQ